MLNREVKVPKTCGFLFCISLRACIFMQPLDIFHPPITVAVLYEEPVSFQHACLLSLHGTTCSHVQSYEYTHTHIRSCPLWFTLSFSTSRIVYGKDWISRIDLAPLTQSSVALRSVKCFGEYDHDGCLFFTRVLLFVNVKWITFLLDSLQQQHFHPNMRPPGI